MTKKTNLSKISPQFIKNKNGKAIDVLLKYSIYESILQDMSHLTKEIEISKKQSLKNKRVFRLRGKKRI